MKLKLDLIKSCEFKKFAFLFLICLLVNSTIFAQLEVAQEVHTDRVEYCPTEPCPCDGNYSQIQVYYFGEDNVTIEAYADRDHTILITSFAGVNNGDLLTIDGTGLANNTLAYKTYLHTTNAADETCQTKIHTSCPSLAWPGSRDDLKILGKTFGDFTVFSRTDSETHFLCDISNVEQDWHVGGNIIGPANNTMGTRNNENVVFISHDVSRGTITNTGDFGINTLSPAAQLDVQGDVIINETLDVNGVTRINNASASTSPADGALIVNGGVGIGENLNVASNARINNDLSVGRDGMLGRNLEVGVDATIINDLEVGNNTAVGNDLLVSHDADINNDLTVGRDGQISRNLNVADNANIGQDLNVGVDAIIGNNLDVNNNLAVSSNALVGQNITVAGDAVVGNDVDVNGDAHIDGIVTVGTINTPNSLGTVNTSQFQLFVEGGILTEEVLVRTGWADYVFDEEYKRPSLDEVEAHINEFGHLPNTPSAKEVEDNGLSLGDTAVLQQEKIEELFLHLIEMNKNIKALQEENEALKAALR